jgi:hypothetical protein
MDGRDMHLDPQLKERGLLEKISYEPERGMGPKRVVVGRPWRFGKLSPYVRGPSPTFGQHNAEVLRNVLGYDDARIQALKDAGVVADKPVKARPVVEMPMEERVKLGRLAYWDPDYKQKLGIE